MLEYASIAMHCMKERPMIALPHDRHTGLVIVSVTFLVAPAMDIFAKLLTATQSPGQVVFGRFLVQTLLLVPLIAWAGQWTRPKSGHWIAGACLAAALLCLNAALVVMPVANALAIFFVEPLILTVLSALILKETIGWRRIAAVAVGLAGALLVIRPNWAAFGPLSVLPLGTALFFAFYVLINRVMTMGGQRIALQFWTGVSSMMIIGVACAAGEFFETDVLALATPGNYEIKLFIAMGVLAVIAHQMILLSLAMIPASLLAPMQYLEIVSAVALGWWVFGDFPDLLTLMGATIIIASGAYVFYRERRAEATDV